MHVFSVIFLRIFIALIVIIYFILKNLTITKTTQFILLDIKKTGKYLNVIKKDAKTLGDTVFVSQKTKCS